MKDLQITWNRSKIEEVLLEAATKEYGERLKFECLWVGEDGYAEYELRVEEEEQND